MSPRHLALLIAVVAPLAACSKPAADIATANGVDAAAVANTIVVAETAGNVTVPATPVAPTGTGIAASPTAKVAAPTGPAGEASDAAKGQADYLGKWIGVEGMVLDVTANPRGGVWVVNQWDLDHKGAFDGSVTAEGLRFMRNGKAVTASFGTGDETGLKYLAGKKRCLVVKSGEGYCRD